MTLTTELVDRIQGLFERYGGMSYEGSRHEPVTALVHALQCAQLAEQAHADGPLVAAAFLHDLGHLVEASDTARTADDDRDDAHETRALPWLAQVFGSNVLEPIRLHVAAKRYLVAVDSGYRDRLSPASRHSLQLQGGPMSVLDCRAFEALPFAQDAMRLRRWDDLAKDPQARTAPLGYYVAALHDAAQRRDAIAQGADAG